MSNSQLSINNYQLPEGYKKTEVGVIPKDWETCPLGDAVDFLDGKRKPIRESQRAKMRGIYPYFGASGIVDYVNDYLFDEDLILLGEDGENILSRSTRLAFRVSGKIWVNNHAHVLKPKSSFDIGFLSEYLESLDYSLYNSGTAQPKLNQQTCQRIPIVRPPLFEQQLIAQALSDIGALIAALDKLIAKKRSIKTGTMQQLLAGKKRLPGFGEGKGYKKTEVGVIPEDWNCTLVDELLELLTDFEANGSFETVATNVRVSNNENFAWYVRATDLENDSPFSELKFVDKKSYSFLKKTSLYGGELLITKRGEIGKVYFFKKRTSYATLAPNLYLLKLNSKTIPSYLYYFFVSDEGQKLLKKNDASSTLGALYKDDVKCIMLPLPSIEEQAAINQVISDMDAEIAALETRRTKTQAIKQGMMQELLTGKTRLI